jgi:adenosylhomocysteine nucleosidase
MKIGLIAAMVEEFEAIESLFSPQKWKRLTDISRSFTVLHLSRDNLEIYASPSGIGKVNASSVTTQLILLFNLDFVLSFGVAGGFQESQQILDYVVSDSFVYVDVDLCNLGCRHGQLVGEPEHFPAAPEFLKIAKSLEGELHCPVHYGRFGSLDQFVRRDKPAVIQEIHDTEPEVICVEMESTAIAHVCAKFSVPMLAIRVLSDVAIASEDGTKSFIETLGTAAKRVVVFIAKFLAKLEKEQNSLCLN